MDREQWSRGGTDIVAAAREVLGPDVAREAAAVFGDHAVFPLATAILEGGSPDDTFPGWVGPVLVLAHENQHVCSWGVPLQGPSAGCVVVGGDLPGGPATVVFAAGVEHFVASRRWDGACLGRTPLVQAQAPTAAGAGGLSYLRHRFAEEVCTFG